MVTQRLDDTTIGPNLLSDSAAILEVDFGARNRRRRVSRSLGHIDVGIAGPKAAVARWW